MSWLTGYSHRQYVSITTGTSTGTSDDIEITLQSDFCEFWDIVQSTGYDIRITLSDGFTVIDHYRASWTYASKTGTIQINTGSPLSLSQTKAIFIYWGNSGASDASSSFTPSANLWEGLIYRGNIYKNYYPFQSNTNASDKVEIEVTKTSNEAIYVWFDVTDTIPELEVIYEGTKRMGGVHLAFFTESTATFSDTSEILYTERAGRHYVGIYCGAAGSSGTTYTFKMQLTIRPDQSVDRNYVVGWNWALRVRDQIDL